MWDTAHISAITGGQCKSLRLSNSFSALKNTIYCQVILFFQLFYKIWNRGRPGVSRLTRSGILFLYDPLRLLLLRYSAHVSNNRRATAGSWRQLENFMFFIFCILIFTFWMKKSVFHYKTCKQIKKVFDYCLFKQVFKSCRSGWF